MQAIIFVDGEITSYADDYFGGTSLKMVRDQLSKYSAYNSVKVYINSPGGSVTEGFAIMDYLHSLPVEVTTVALGQCASIATAIFLAGKNREIGKYAEFFIHLPWGAAMGTAEELEAYSKLVKQSEEQLINLYVDKTGIDRDLVADLMKAQTSLTADQAKEYGFATIVLEPVMALAKLDTPNQKQEVKPAPVIHMNTKNLFEQGIDLLKQAFAGKNTTLSTVALERTTVEGIILNIQTTSAEENIEVGNKVTVKESAEALEDGTHLLQPDNLTITVQAGVITDVALGEQENNNENTEMENKKIEELQAQNTKLQEELTALKESYQTEVQASTKFRDEVTASLKLIQSGGKVTRDDDEQEEVKPSKGGKLQDVVNQMKNKNNK